MGLINIKNIDLSQKLSRNTKIHKNKENKRVLGRSIEERSKEVDTREEFGHWETDLVIGQKSGKDDVLLTLLERKTRDFSIIRLPDKSADSVLDAFQKIQSELGDYFSKVFRTITTDNSSEFARLSELETGTNNSVAYKLDLAFQEKGVTHFNYIICTHPDEDHYEGFLNLLKGNGQTRTYGKFDCSTEVDDNTTTKYREFASSVQTTFKRITVPLVGTVFKLGSVCVEVFGGQFRWKRCYK